jgi:hypothetical protein
MVDITDSERAREAFYNEAMGDAPPLAPGDELDNAIHPLFDQKNILCTDSKDKNCKNEDMHIIPDETYAAMRPALRLATLLITEPKMLEPWDYIANGVEIDGSLEDEEFADTYVAYGGEFELTPLGREIVNKIFLWMSGGVKIRFFDKFEAAESHGALGQAKFYPEKMNGKCLIARGEMEVEGQAGVWAAYLARGTISMQSFLSRHFVADHIHNNRPEHQLITTFEFVCTLLHELMHLFGRYVRGNDYNEPRYEQSQAMRELGHAYEAWLLRGKLSYPLFRGQFSNPNDEEATLVCILLYDWVVHPTDEFHFELVGEVQPESGSKGVKRSAFSKIMCHRAELPEGVVESVPFLTAKVVQMWFSKAAWRRIGKEAHGFIWAEASRSIFTIEQGRHTLSYDDVVYKSLDF